MKTRGINAAKKSKLAGLKKVTHFNNSYHLEWSGGEAAQITRLRNRRGHFYPSGHKRKTGNAMNGGGTTGESETSPDRFQVKC